MRHYEDWLTEYVRYASFSEAPSRMHFWAGVSAIAGAMSRRVWIDMQYFKWYCNMYIVFVAPPGVVAKSSTINIAQDLLRQVPGIKFGPDVVTWQALITAFANSTEMFEWPANEFIPMSSLTIAAEELGNFIDPNNREMIDMFVRLWDCRTVVKITKGSGNDLVENPWINLIGCTTPAWIAGTFPDYIIGGGFTSRCLFIYTDEKAKLVAYPNQVLPADHQQTRQKLIEDLQNLASTYVGEFKLTPEAIHWGTVWYKFHWENRPADLDDERFKGYLARKQTHIHKAAMIIAASQHSPMSIEVSHLQLAHDMVGDLEADMQKVYAGIGRTRQSIHADQLIRFIQRKGMVPFWEAYQHVHHAFPDVRQFEGVLNGAIRAGLIFRLDQKGQIFLTRDNPFVQG